MAEITFTKIEAARKQIRAAIELWFKSDEIPAQALAYSSYEIVHRYCRKKGIESLVYDTHAIKDEKIRTKFNLLLKDVPNWLKHAEREEEFNDTKTLNPWVTQLFLMNSLVGLKRVGEKLRAFESAFFYWNYIHHRDWFPENSEVKGIPPERISEFSSFTREQFLPAYIALWSEGGRYVVN